MAAATIQNPIINSAFAEPGHYFATASDGTVSGVKVDGRRLSEFFVPVARPKRAPAQSTLDLFGGPVRQQANEGVNAIRASVDRWRRSGYPHTTGVTRELLDSWKAAEDRHRPLFFCQIEAIETAVYLTEAADRMGDMGSLTIIRQESERLNDGLQRMAFKMATGSGKTVVMAMLICWQTLNKAANPRDRRFGDRFLIVTPGITIRDRLRVLQPNDPQNYYRAMDLVTPEQYDRLQAATIVITNFQALQRRQKIEAARLDRQILTGFDASDDRFRETPAEMVNRVCREFPKGRRVIVINDEAHHCYQHAPADEEGALEADDRVQAKKDAEEARVWLSGLQAVRERFGVANVFDLSATPFFLSGSGYREGTLFPWVVSDFGLMDAIECGIVKIPRLPVSDDSMTGEGPVYRSLWLRVCDVLPRRGARDVDFDAERPIPKELEGALRSLYADYERRHQAWQQAGMGTPPVFIVICANTATSKLVADWIAGYAKTLGDGATVAVPGNLPLFSNVQEDRFLERPNTILVDSVQLDQDEALDPAFRKAAAAEIERFKREYVMRVPGALAEDITDVQILREVMNTVGKPGQLGEHVRCVVSVAMLTEGWDANTVTHILGIRAFGTQLLCEQVVGRALRRATYDTNDAGMFDPEYAEVYGVPFNLLAVAGSAVPRPPKPVREVRSLPERAELRIEFPRLMGYRYDLPPERLIARFDASSILQLSAHDLALRTDLDPIVGETTKHTIEPANARLQTIAFSLAKRTLEDHFQEAAEDRKPWLFPQLARIARDWIETCVMPYLKDGAFPGLLLFAEYSHGAAERIYRAVAAGAPGQTRLLPILRPYDPLGSTDGVSFQTTKTCYETTKSHLNLVVQDSGWESKLADVLEHFGPAVVAYAKNQGLDFKIPYTYEGRAGNYVPDFLVRLHDAASIGDDDLLSLIIEVTGEPRPEKQAKTGTAEHLWVPAVNAWGGAGRWAFLEVTDPWDAEHLIRDLYVEPAPVPLAS
ncbi:MAG: BPTD_3080 family restriction endonuclease [Candidatus Limnocylindrales bacterium]